MINFRYHLVSLTAIFLALGLGIVMGVTVVGEGVLKEIEDQLNRVERRADSVDATHDRLIDDLDHWTAFDEQAGDALVAGRLDGLPIALVTVEGVEGDIVARIEASLRSAGASIPFEILLKSRFLLEDEGSVRDLGAILGTESVEPQDLRQQAAALLAESWAGRAREGLLRELQEASFVEVVSDLPGPDLPEVAQVAPRFVVLSSANADIQNEALSVPLVVAMGETGIPVVAADVSGADRTPEPQGREVEPGSEAPFAVSLRDEDEVRSRISTVDHAAGFRGRVAVILSLVQLGEGRFGHYGTAAGAERLLPD